MEKNLGRNNLLLGMVGTAHEWSRLDVSKSHRQPLLFQSRKFGRIVIPGNGQMVSRRLEVLADGDDVAADCSQVAHDVAGLIHCLPHTQDQTRLSRHAMLFGLSKKFKRSLIFPLRPERWKEPPDGFNVVIQNLRLLGADGRKRRLIPFKVRNQDFNRASGTQPSRLTDGLSKDRGAAVWQLVTIY